MTKSEITSFQKTILNYAHNLYRPMPWRENPSHYFVYVSEIMLQQTRVERVMAQFASFIQAFPSFDDLANADLSTVYSEWKGLGYNRRALWLRDGAKTIIESHNDILPKDPNLLSSIKGIGINTASAMVVYAHNIPIPFIETNIRAIYIHHFFPNNNNVSDSEIFSIVQETLSEDNARQWFYALMDYGADLKLREKNPSRRSAGHRKQSPFTGSFRQIRGETLAQLAHKSLKVSELESIYGCDRTLLIVRSLEKDGLIIINGDTLHIAE